MSPYLVYALIGAGLAALWLTVRWLLGRARKWFRVTYRRAPGKPTPWTDESDPEIGWTYEIYQKGRAPFTEGGAGGYLPARRAQLLYVGSAKRHPFGRLADHVTKEWFPSDALIRCDKHIHYAAAHDAEIVKIQDLLPSENKIRYTSKRVSRPAGELTPVSTHWIRLERER
jgi:hypothetical protein